MIAATGSTPSYVMNGYAAQALDRGTESGSPQPGQLFRRVTQSDSPALLREELPPPVLYERPSAGGIERKSLAELQAYARDTLLQQGEVHRIAEGVEVFPGLSRDAALELLEEEGYFGADQSAERIIERAMQEIFDDPASYTPALNALMAAFSEAQSALGNPLPIISYKALDTVHSRLAEWWRGFLPTLD